MTRHSKVIMLPVIMLPVIMLPVIFLSVIMLPGTRLHVAGDAARRS